MGHGDQRSPHRWSGDRRSPVVATAAPATSGRCSTRTWVSVTCFIPMPATSRRRSFGVGTAGPRYQPATLRRAVAAPIVVPVPHDRRRDESASALRARSFACANARCSTPSPREHAPAWPSPDCSRCTESPAGDGRRCGCSDRNNPPPKTCSCSTGGATARRHSDGAGTAGPPYDLATGGRPTVRSADRWSPAGDEPSPPR